MFNTNSDMYMTGSITVIKDGSPLKDADIDVFDQVRKTDQKGYAPLEHIYKGVHSVKIIYNGEVYQQDFDFKDQNSVLTVTSSSSTFTSVDPKATAASTTDSNSSKIIFPIIAIVLTLLILISLLIALIKKFGVNFIKTILAKKKVSSLIVGGFLIFFLLASLTVLLVNVLDKNKTIQINENSKAATISASIPVPENVKVEQDDRMATVSWNNLQEQEGVISRPDGVNGYYVTWGKSGSAQVSELTDAQAIQLQPLDENVDYTVQIQSIDSTGSLSNPTPKITFRSDPTRVNALRTKMNGFFDDFNQPAGPFDEKKWNNAYSGCIVPNSGGQFINTQYHAHNQLYSGLCDRGQNHSRPRQVFDFTNRTGTISFDFDGALKRDQWYLDLNNANLGPIDITGHVALEDIDGVPSDPKNTLRIHQNGDKVNIFYFDNNGVERDTTPASNPDSLCGLTSLLFCKYNLSVINNVRRHWEIKISKTKVEVRINGVLINDAKVNLPYDKAYTDWIAFSYNTGKSSEKSVLMHWDNYGFDAPAGFQPVETHNYTDGYVGTEGGVSSAPPDSENVNYLYPVAELNNPIKRNIKIPDSLANSKAQRLQFTLQYGGGAFDYAKDSGGWTSADHVLINGQKFNFPRPTGVGSEIVSPYTPFGALMNIPAGVFKTGDNQIEFHLNTVGVFNIHAEFDFTPGSAPSYSDPKAVYGQTFINKIMPPTPNIGPGATIQKINNKDLGIAGTAPENSGVQANLSGTANVEVEFTNVNQMIGTGKNYGIKRYELLIDRKVVANTVTIIDDNHVPVPYLYKSFSLNTADFCNGKHEIYARAYNKYGVVSNTDYFQGADVVIDSNMSIGNGYFPLFININNSGKSACSGSYIPSATPAPDPNPFPGSGLPVTTTVQVSTPANTTTPVVTTTPIVTSTVVKTTTPVVTSTVVKTTTPVVTSPITTTTPVVTTTPLVSTTPVSTSCLCSNDVCSTACKFTNTTNAGLKCNREVILGGNVTQTDKNNYCKVVLKTQGDADGDGIVNNLDYLYYVRGVNGGGLPANINIDFNGDGVASPSDRAIIIGSLNK